MILTSVFVFLQKSSQKASSLVFKPPLKPIALTPDQIASTNSFGFIYSITFLDNREK